jgi:RecA/RadA recombinase
MSKKTETKAVEQVDAGITSLREKAKLFKNHLNHQYQQNVAYVPDATNLALVTVSKWLKMPPAFEEVTRLPGLPIGNITHVYGKPNAGKTTLLMEGIVAAQKQGILPILILTEHKFDFSRISKMMGGDEESIVVLHANTIEEAYGFMEKTLKDLAEGKLEIEQPDGSTEVLDMSKQDCFIFMDSLGNTMSESEMEYEVSDWDKSMGKAAKAIKNLTKRINNLLSKVRQRCGILLLNQSYQSMPSYGPSVETPFGGDGAPYSCVLNIRLRRVGDIKVTTKGQDLKVGLETKVEVMKNHISNIMATGSFYTTGSGIISIEDKAALDEYKKKYVR